MNHITYYKENFDETKARFQQWWKGNSLGRPMLALSARRERPLPVDPPEPFADLTDKYTHVERQISHFRFNAAHRSYLGESFPALNVVWGLPLLAEYFGARPEYLPNTVWYERCVFDYNRDLPSLRLKPDHPLFLHHQQMLRKAVSLADSTVTAVVDTVVADFNEASKPQCVAVNTGRAVVGFAPQTRTTLSIG